MKALKLILVLAVVLVLVVVGGVAAFITFTDPNDFKDRIAARVFLQTGRALTLEGDLEWAFWPKLTLKTGAVELSNAAGFGDEPFLRAEEFQIAVATLPLLKKQIEMDTVKLVGARINLARNADGATNWEDLAGDVEDEEKSSGDIAAIALGGVDIQDAALSWRDAGTGQSVDITKVNFSTGALAFGEPIAFKVSLRVVANQPAVDSDVALVGTVSYDLGEETYHVEPLTLEVLMRGAHLPGGEAKLATSAILDIDLDEGTARLGGLTLNGLGTALNGELEATDIESEHPGARGTLQLTGSDLGALFAAFKLPVAKQIQALDDRKFNFATEFVADMQSGKVSVPKLEGAMLGAALNGTFEAERANTDTPSAQGSIAAHGPDLPSLLAVFGQLQGMDAATSANLVQVLRGAKDKSFSLQSSFDADMQTGQINLPKLEAKLLGNSLSGNVVSSAGSGGKAAFNGSVNAQGPDLPSLLAVVGQLQGMDAATLKNLVQVLRDAQDKSFVVQSSFNADTNGANVNLPKLEAKLLGNTISGEVSSKKSGGDKTALNGKINASGPDLPSLLAIAAAFQGPGSTLGDTAKSLAGAADKAFTLSSSFATDQANGTIDLPQLSAQGLGLRIDGKMKAQNMDSDSGTIDGTLAVKGDKIGPLLTAFGQPDLAKSVSAINLNAGIKGTKAKMTFSPLTLVATVTGPGQTKPVNLDLAVATAQANLTEETLNVQKLTLTGLGMNISGDVNATKIKSAPAFNGTLNVPNFNLRNVLVSLNQKLPPMADQTALTSFGLNTAFSGTGKSIALRELTLKLDESTLKGDFAINDFAGPDVQFGLGVDQINADRYMAPKAAGRVPVTPEAAAAGAAQLPVETLRKLKIKGDLLVGNLQFSGAKMQNVKLSISAAGGKIVAKPIAAALYNGAYDGAIDIDATQKMPIVALSTNLGKVNIEPLLFDMTGERSLAGVANLNAALKATGNNTKALKSSLSGPVKFLVQNGVYRGIDVASLLTQIEVMIESKRPSTVTQGGETKFQALSGTIQFTNGVGMNNDLLLDGSGFKITGNGMVANLNDDTMKYDAKVAVDSGTTQRGEETYNLGNYAVPIRCRGKLGANACKPDVGDIVAEIGKGAVKKEIGKQLEKAVGGEAGEALKKLFKF